MAESGVSASAATSRSRAACKGRLAAAVRRARPWRKPVAEVEAERQQADAILSASPKEAAESAGVDVRALLFALLAQESLDELGTEGSSIEASRASFEPEAVVAAQVAVDELRRAATNASSTEEVEAARASTTEALQAAGLDEPLRARLARPPVGKYDVCHQVLPGLWLGGFVALNNDCEELRRRRVTHVVSVVSADRRTLPNFIRGHLHIRADDREDAAAGLSVHFPDICRFVDGARSEPRGCVYVHCGAGISRAPTAAASYVMWKLGISAAAAIRLIRRARPGIRPNLGFVKQLRVWEAQMHSLPGGGDSLHQALAVPAPQHHVSGSARGRSGAPLGRAASPERRRAASAAIAKPPSSSSTSSGATAVREALVVAAEEVVLASAAGSSGGGGRTPHGDGGALASGVLLANETD